MRGATFEIVPPKKVKYSPQGFTDDIVYVEGKKKPSFEWPPKLPVLPPWTRKHDGKDDKGDRGPGVSGVSLAAGTLLGLGLLGGGGLLVANATACAGMSLYEVIAIAEEIFEEKLGPDSKPWVERKSDDVDTPHQHHIFVQQLKEILKEYKVDIDVHEFTMFLPPSFHSWLHATGWNKVLRTFIELQLSNFHLTGQILTRRVKCFAWLMMKEWGVAELLLERFRNAKP